MSARPIGSHGHYPRHYFPVPAAVAAAARDGLALRKRFGRGGTDVGIARARQLASGSPRVTLRDIIHIRAYLRRHVVDNLEQKSPPSNGWIAWQLWGGWPAKKWAESIYKRANASGWIARPNPTPDGADEEFWTAVDGMVHGFVSDPRAAALLRRERFTAWDDGGCLALQQALLGFLEDQTESRPDIEATTDIQPAFVISGDLVEHALVWVERHEGSLVIDSDGAKPGDVSASDWQRRQRSRRETMTVIYDDIPEGWFAVWRERIAPEPLVAEVRTLLEEHFVMAQKINRPRNNPFDDRGMPLVGKSPYIMVRCVNGVIGSKLKNDGRRKAKAEDVSSAHAICTSQLQKQGVLRDGTHELTAKGRRRNDAIYAAEKGPVATARLAEYEEHLRVAGRPRSNPTTDGANELLKIVAPLVVPEHDADRMDEAVKIVAGDPLYKIDSGGRFWEPLIAARGSLSKTIATVADHLPSSLRLPAHLVVLDAIRLRAMDGKAARAATTMSSSRTRVESPGMMMGYLSSEIDPFLGYWSAGATLQVLIREATGPRAPLAHVGLKYLDAFMAWSRGEKTLAHLAEVASNKEFDFESPFAGAAGTLLRMASDLAQYGTLLRASRSEFSNRLVGAMGRYEPWLKMNKAEREAIVSELLARMVLSTPQMVVDRRVHRS